MGSAAGVLAGGTGGAVVFLHTPLDKFWQHQDILYDYRVELNGVGNRSQINTIRYDSVYLTCSKKLTGSQLSLPHGTNKKLNCKNKNKMMSVTGPIQSRYREAVQ